MWSARKCVISGPFVKVIQFRDVNSDFIVSPGFTDRAPLSVGKPIFYTGESGLLETFEFSSMRDFKA